MAGVYKGLNIKFGADTTDLDQAIGKISSKGNKLARDLKQVDKALKLDPKNTDLLKLKFEGVSKQVANTEERLKALKAAESQLGKGGMSTGQWDKLQRDIALTESSLKNYTKQLKDANAQYAAATSGLGQMGSKITEIGETLTPMGEKLQSIGGKMTAALTTTAVAAGTASVKTAMDFETSLAKVSTLADEAVMSMEEMGDGARDLAKKYGVSASDINEALYQSMSASVETGEALEFVDQATKLAKAGFTSSATAVDTLTTAINAYGMSAEDAEHISDVLVNTQNLGKTTVDELGASMGTVIPTAAAYGVNLENLASAYTIMTKQGINTANATTYLSGMFTELADEGSSVAKILQEQTGKSFSELMADGQSLGDVMSVLYGAVDNDSTAFANLWGNVRAGRGALAIANGGVEEFNGTLESMVSATGIVDTALEKVGGTTQAQFNKMKAAIEDASIAVGQALIPVVTEVMDGVKDLADAFNGLSDEEQQNVIKTAAVVAGLGPAITLLGTLMVNVERVGKGMMTFAELLAKVDIATGNFGGSVKKVDAATGKMVTSATKASVAMAALKASAAAAAVVGVLILVNAIKDYVEKQREFTQATKGLEDAVAKLEAPVGRVDAGFSSLGKSVRGYAGGIDEAISKQADFAKKIDDAASEYQSSAALAETYADQIKSLTENWDGSAESVAALKMAVDGYNDATGSSIEITDAVAGKLSVSTDELDANTKAWEANARAQAAQELYAEGVKEQIKLDAEAAKAKEKLEQAEKNLQEAQASKDLGKILEAQTAYDSLNAKYKEAQRLADANAEAVEKLKGQMTDYAVEAQIAAQTTDDFRSALEYATGNVYEFDDLAINLETDADSLASSITDAGISTQMLASVGADSFAALYKSANGDMQKVKAALDLIDAAKLEDKIVHIKDDGTVEVDKKVLDLKGDIATLDGKTIDFYARDYASETIDALIRKINGISSSAISVAINAAGFAAGAISRVPLSAIPRHADGGMSGIVQRPTLTNIGLVGEAGAEAIIPLTNRRYVRPFAQAVAAEMGSGGQVVNNYEITLAYDASADAAQMTRDIARNLKLLRMTEA